MPIVTLEEVVVEHQAIPSLLPLVEVVHVELSNEGAHVAVFEVESQNLLAEHAFVEDFEAVSLFCPANDVSEVGVADDVKQFGEEDRHQSLLLSAGGLRARIRVTEAVDVTVEKVVT